MTIDEFDKIKAALERARGMGSVPASMVIAVVAQATGHSEAAVREVDGRDEVAPC